MRNLKVAVVQFRSSEDAFENLIRANDFVLEAQKQGAELVCFPENLFYRGPKRRRDPQGEVSFSRNDLAMCLDASGALLAENELSIMLKEFAQDWTTRVSLGSVLEKSADPERPYNAHWVYDPYSKKITSYKKIHLFDYQGAVGSYHESKEISPGAEAVTVEINGWKIGLSICYDLRFPELYRQLSLKKGCHVLLIPAAFTLETGRVHWNTLQRARAIENQCFVVASAQWGAHEDNSGKQFFCFGHSLIYDPWGENLAEASEIDDSLAIVELNMDRLLEVREKLPSLKNARLL